MRLPLVTRLAAFGLALGFVLYVCLTPLDRLPAVGLWDKAEHAGTWAGLTLLGLTLFPRRRRAIPALTIGFGALVEVLQQLLPVGRTGDPLDLAADLVGVAAAVLLVHSARRSPT